MGDASLPQATCLKCDKKIQARELCATHYSQELRAGRIIGSRYTTKMPISDRLAHFSVREESTRCQLWTGCKNSAGYGRLGVANKVFLAHRLAYEQAFGQIANGMCVCHKCDVPACINPSHLFLGTNADNAEDKVSKNRQMRGEAYTPSKLTDEKVREIRQDERSQQVIADDLGISQSEVSFIKLRKRWAHVE